MFSGVSPSAPTGQGEHALTYDFSRKIELTAEPVTEGHTRYILVLGDAPNIVTINGLIDFWVAAQDPDSAAAQEDLLAVLILTPDGNTEAVNIEKTDDGLWMIYQSHADGGVIEEIQYDPNDDDNVLHHEVYVETFETDQVPVFLAGAPA
jgi:hypothetical protein